MTKTISLADDAYELLAAAKRPGESFSDVARRLGREAALDDLLDPEQGLDISDGEVKKRIGDIRRWRDESLLPRDRR